MKSETRMENFISLNEYPFDVIPQFEQVTLFNFKKLLTAHLASLILDWICRRHCKSHDKSLEPGRLRQDINWSLFYLGWPKFLTPPWPIFEKYLQ